MENKPGPSVGRGAIIVQPAYFTSNLYSIPLRDDVMSLSHKYIQRYNADPSKPFHLFKELWKSDGWPWMHFKVYDPRSRETFLNTTLRIFLEGTAPSQAPLRRATSLFGMYTFFYTQPSSSTPPIHAVSRIPIPIDLLTSLISFPDSLTTTQLSPLRPHIAYIVHKFLNDQIFDILPSSELCPLNPRHLPREYYRPVEFSLLTTSETEGKSKRKAGRPSKHERAQKAQEATENLEKWLKDPPHSPPHHASSRSPANTDTTTRSDDQPVMHKLLMTDPMESRARYQADKAVLLRGLKDGYSSVSRGSSDTGSAVMEGNEGRNAFESANRFILTRMRKLEEDARKRGLEVGGEGGELTTLSRVEKAAAEMELDGDDWRGGILGLSNGAGN